MESVSLTMKVESRSGYNPEIELVRSAIYEDILAMAKVCDLPLTSYPFSEIIPSLKQLLDQAAYLWNRKEIDPWLKFALLRMNLNIHRSADSSHRHLSCCCQSIPLGTYACWPVSAGAIQAG